MYILTIPTTNKYKITLRQNLMKNIPVKNKNINLVESLYRKNISSLQGKCMKNKPKPLLENVIKILRELVSHNRLMELCVDK